MGFIDELFHYGTPRHSGRYPWGSGENPYQHSGFSLSLARDLKAQGLSDTEIAKRMGMSTTQYRAERSIAKDAERAERASRALRLADKGYSNTEIGHKMGLPESTVRSLLDPTYESRANKTKNTANILKNTVDEKGYIDVSSGVELDAGVSRDRFKTAIAMLEKEGYKKYYIQVDQLGTTHKTSIEVLCPPGTEFKELYQNRDQIKTLTDHTPDRGETWTTFRPPTSVSSDRVMIRYNEEGGLQKDGVIDLRRGVDDLSLGNSRYAQVRIGVDGTHYLKGMAMYSDNMPDGVDIVFNTNKHTGTPKEEVFKKMRTDKNGAVDMDNPFGATIKSGGQHEYVDANGKVQLSPINIVNEEGDWGKWSKNLASQFLSKQSPKLAKKQLDLAYADKREEFEQIKNLENPAVKRKLLESFADDCDSSAVHLKAAALPGQQSHVILPFPEMKDTEVYAPNYKDGTQLALVRYPHGGTFEIPILTVNNKQKDAKSTIGNASDAIGINSKVAERLSGADFDGDTVLAIPTTNVKIRSTSPLKGLENFDPKESYPGYEGMAVIKSQTKQTEMGKVSNLITDMTLKGASTDEIARAVRHSMVVIDAEKHKLNYKLSEQDNGIAALKKKYQDNGDGKTGASTLISRAKSQEHVPTRKESFKIDPLTGEKVYTETGETYVNKKGKEVKRMQKSTKMYEVKDAYELSSGTQIENVYADYANKMKALGNEARKEYLSTEKVKYSPEANKQYASEVVSLNAKLNTALKNAPRERQAQLLANKIVSVKKESNPDMSNDDLKKVKSQALASARYKTGAKKDRVHFTEKEWEAVQSGAISDSKLSRLLNNADLDEVKALATPRQKLSLSSAQIALIKSMEVSGYSTADIAQRLGVSSSTVSKYANR